MNTQLVESLIQVINSLSPEERDLLENKLQSQSKWQKMKTRIIERGKAISDRYWIDTQPNVTRTAYLYLPRLKNEQVLLDVIARSARRSLSRFGVGNLLWNENFAYATGYNETKYLGLEFGRQITPTISSLSLLVKPDIAQQQIEKEVIPPPPPPIIQPDPDGEDDPYPPLPPLPPPPPPKKKRRFYGSIELDSQRLIANTRQIADEVLQHLVKLKNADVEITLEISAKVSDGISDDVNIQSVKKERTR